MNISRGHKFASIGLAVAAAVLLLAAGLFVFEKPGAASSKKPDIDVYRGLGTWIDIYDLEAWEHPKATIRAMKKKGVRTLYLETGNSNSKGTIYRRKGTGKILDAAHAAGIEVVAWYLPTLTHPKRDYRRSKAAIRFRSEKGERFDSFALDIESSDVHNVKKRTKRLLELSRKLRKVAGPEYPLGAIIPSPRGMQIHRKYWPRFPYKRLAAIYDVFVPMGYYTWRPKDLGGSYGYTRRNIQLIRSKTGNPNVPIHVIGGIGDDSSKKQTRRFVRAAKDCGIDGASMYAFFETRRTAWKYLRKVPKRAATPLESCR